ncbi:rhodanese-like domain-containing protein [Candidatus Deianiraea vastatrix]|uniref:Sulfurtransferase n=1 Tax=Candidatus Deianiraea vastatrix TaxID=2163644 RepID=A0A5B8XEN7_9RICK|nr:rhodanese-like domain-containing protein [Candidatus Deianiraea vastatrix]QED23782.1 Putative sulfurtransferase [Candidatus Deianiraea vastatrix]
MIHLLEVQDLKKKLKNGSIFLIDVREPSENAASSIPGSILMPLGTINLAEVRAHNKDNKPIALHCKGGVRSLEACKKLLEEDANLEVYNVEGGILAWHAMENGEYGSAPVGGCSAGGGCSSGGGKSSDSKVGCSDSSGCSAGVKSECSSKKIEEKTGCCKDSNYEKVELSNKSSCCKGGERKSDCCKSASHHEAFGSSCCKEGNKGGCCDEKSQCCKSDAVKSGCCKETGSCCKTGAKSCKSHIPCFQFWLIFSVIAVYFPRALHIFGIIVIFKLIFMAIKNKSQKISSGCCKIDSKSSGCCKNGKQSPSQCCDDAKTCDKNSACDDIDDDNTSSVCCGGKCR